LARAPNASKIVTGSIFFLPFYWLNEEWRKSKAGKWERPKKRGQKTLRLSCEIL
jgi:hypothetical protein